MPPRKKAESTRAEQPIRGPDNTGFLNLMSTLKTKYPGRIFRGDEYTMPWAMRRLPTGILKLDIDLRGGLPAGGMTMLVAPEGIGKNWLCNQVIKNQQILFGERCRIGVVSLEMPYDKLFARDCGVRIALSPQEIRSIERAEAASRQDESFRFSAEEKAAFSDQIGEFVVCPPDTAERALSIATEMVASREFNVVMIDSFGSMLTELEDQNTLEDNVRPGGASIVNSQFAKRINAATAPDKNGMPNLTCILGINQVRDNMKKATPFSPDTIEAGGHALKHARWVTIQLRRLAYVNKKIGESQVRIGKTIEYEIMKQKAGGHEGGKGNYDFIFSLVGFDRVKESIRTASEYDVVIKNGAMYEFGELSVRGIDAFTEKIREMGPEVLAEIERLTLHEAGIKCNYTDEDNE